MQKNLLAYKVSLCENFQQQNVGKIIQLSHGSQMLNLIFLPK